MSNVVVLLACLVISVSAQTLLKIGVHRQGGVQLGQLADIWKTFTNPVIVAGFVCYFLGSYLWLAVLSRYTFSRANLYFSSNHIITLAIAIFWFGDKLSPVNLVGAAMTIAGLYLVSLQ